MVFTIHLQLARSGNAIMIVYSIMSYCWLRRDEIMAVVNVPTDRKTDQAADPTAEAILRTLLYADVFSFPMTEAEIVHFLIGLSATPAEIRAALEQSLL